MDLARETAKEINPSSGTFFRVFEFWDIKKLYRFE
jgi:hypothetical protein